MKTVTIKDMPPKLHRELKARAKAHGRSLNTEVLAVLEASVFSQPVNVEDLIREARALRESMKCYLTQKELDKLKSEGRP